MKQSQDLSSQVMVEVGLALAMAFFSLFVLSLFLFSVSNVTELHSKQTNNPLHNQDESTLKLSVQASTEQRIDREQHDKTIANNTIYLFVKGSVIYNESLKPVNIDTLPKNANIVVAVPDHFQLNELITLQKQINQPNASITNLTNDWFTAMEQLP